MPKIALKRETINAFLNRNTQRDTITKVFHNDVTYNDRIDIDNQFANFFSQLESYPAPLNEVDLDRLPHSLFLFPTPPDEICNVIRHIKVTGAGLDGIHSTHIKMVAHLTSNERAFIANLLFKTGVLPQEHKQGKIIPVDKKEILHCLIPIAPFAYYLFGAKELKLIALRLNNYLNKFNTLSPFQFGFFHLLTNLKVYRQRLLCWRRFYRPNESI